MARVTRTSKRTGSTTPPRQGERWTAARRAAYEKRRREGRPTKPWLPVHPDDEPFYTVSHASREAMHSYLDNVESLLLMIRQRDMDPDHTDRLARLIQEAERDLLGRISTSSVVRGRRNARVRSSGGSGSRAA